MSSELTAAVPPVPVKIYASVKRADTFLYLPAEQSTDTIPQTLNQLLGNLRFVLELELTPERQLANAQAPLVISALADQGFYVQMPPPIRPGSARP